VSGIDLSASAYNLFDKNYGDPAAGELQIDPEQPELGLDAVVQDGRTFRMDRVSKIGSSWSKLWGASKKSRTVSLFSSVTRSVGACFKS
jgi:hypothetical protein